MKRTLVNLIVTSLVLSHAPLAFAQEQTVDAKAEAAASVAMPEPYSDPVCVARGITHFPTCWALLLELGYVPTPTARGPQAERIPVPVPANYSNTYKAPSKAGQKAIVIGFLATLTGAVMFIPNGEDFDVFGDKFCVTNEYRTYTDGACSTSSMQKKAATAVLLSGLTILTAGVVAVKASASKQGYGASATLRW